MTPHPGSLHSILFNNTITTTNTATHKPYIPPPRKTKKKKSRTPRPPSPIPLPRLPIPPLLLLLLRHGRRRPRLLPPLTDIRTARHLHRDLHALRGPIPLPGYTFPAAAEGIAEALGAGVLDAALFPGDETARGWGRAEGGGAGGGGGSLEGGRGEGVADWLEGWGGEGFAGAGIFEGRRGLVVVVGWWWSLLGGEMEGGWGEGGCGLWAGEGGEVRREAGAGAMLRGGFRVVWGGEVWGWGGAGAEGGRVWDSVVVVVVFGGAIDRRGGVGEGSVEGPLRLFFLRVSGRRFVGESLAVVLRLLRRALVGRSMAALRSVG